MAVNYTDKEIENNIKKFYASLNTVNVSCTTGSTVYMSKDGEVLYANENNGVWTFHPMEFGTWTIHAERGQSTLSPAPTVNIDSIAIRTVTLSF